MSHWSKPASAFGLIFELGQDGNTVLDTHAPAVARNPSQSFALVARVRAGRADR